MLTLQDCLGLCALTEEEILAIAEHEHLPEIAAIELAEYLIHQPDGALRIKRMIVDDIAAAQARGDHLHAAKLKTALRHFCTAHLAKPEARVTT